MSATVLHHIDEPTRWDLATPIVIVRGWCFDRRGDSVVAIEAVTAGGVLSAPVGLSRPDVGVAFNDEPGAATSGFSLWFFNRGQDAGPILLRAVHRDGSRTNLRQIEASPFRDPTAA